ncbi:MAG: cyclic nucleotide-binding domain-containing protein [Fibrobacteria bacterium]|nr:cyclic nucleotide-binding domain-containing protein [Fibrobacteria bacterium]
MITIRQFAKGEVLIKENDPGDTAYIIERGKVEVTREVNGKRIHLTYLNGGETVGEMSVIDEKPRSATVTAVEETVVREVHRDGLFQTLKAHPDVSLNLLSALFERLREANMTILHLQSKYEKEPTGMTTFMEPPSEKDLAENKGKPHAAVSVTLEGMTPEAELSLPSSHFTFSKFPFRLGRDVNDPLIQNDLKIPDKQPWQISRHHVSFISENGNIGVFDRGSHLGAIVDGKPIGSKNGQPGPVFFKKKEGTLTLGTAHSKYTYRVVINI